MSLRLAGSFLSGPRDMVRERLSQRTGWTAEEAHLRLSGLHSHMHRHLSPCRLTHPREYTRPQSKTVASQELFEKGLSYGGELWSYVGCMN